MPALNPCLRVERACLCAPACNSRTDPEFIAGLSITDIASASGVVLEIQVTTQCYSQGKGNEAIRGTSSGHKVEQAESCHHV